MSRAHKHGVAPKLNVEDTATFKVPGDVQTSQTYLACDVVLLHAKEQSKQPDTQFPSSVRPPFIEYCWTFTQRHRFFDPSIDASRLSGSLTGLVLCLEQVHAQSTYLPWSPRGCFPSIR